MPLNKMTLEELKAKLHYWSMLPTLTGLIEIVEEFMQDHDLPYWRMDNMTAEDFPADLPIGQRLSHYESLMAYLDEIGDKEEIDAWLSKAVAEELAKDED